MKVLKVVAEGVTTSFRYPHFMQQIHPTYPMPPPATIYGHIASALGEWFDPRNVRYACHFTYSGQTTDIEHIIVQTPSSGYLPGTRIPKVQEGNINPFDRDLLFQPKLTLYINQPEWEQAFRSPRYAVILGRSQDLFTYTSVEVVELQRAEYAYFEHTLAPHEMALQFGRGIAVTMPKYVDNYANRAPTFGQYVILRDRVCLPNDETFQFSHIRYGPYWIDPSSPAHKDKHLGLAFLEFVSGDRG